MSKTQIQPQSTSPVPAAVPTATPTPNRASVPISVYRQLADELKTAEEQLTSLKSENQQLLQNNRRLRQEASRLFLSAQQLQQFIASSDEYGKPIAVAPPQPEVPDADIDPQQPDNWVIEIAEKNRPSSSDRNSSEINAWVLATVVGLIVLSALGLGFLAMRFAMSSKR